jgi:uncharacterized protein (DUF927 family)
MSNDNNQDTINNETVDSPKNNASSKVKPLEFKPARAYPCSLSMPLLSEDNPYEDYEENNESDNDNSSQRDSFDKSSLPVTIRDKNGIAHPLIYDIEKYRVSLKNGVEIAKTIKVIDPTTNKKIEEIHFETLSFVPIAPIVKYHNKDTKEVDVLVGWLNGDKHFQHKILMTKLLTKRGIHEFSNLGVNFPDKKGGDMAEYFSHILEENKDIIPEEDTYNIMGWRDNYNSFVIGKNKIYLDENKKVQTERVEINANYSFIDAFNKKGDIKEWLRATRPLMVYKSTRFSCYAVISSFLLSILGEQSKLIHRWGDSSLGKSTLHNVAMSMLGSPKQLNLTGDASKTGFEEMLSFLNNVPANFDDIQIDPELKKKIAYLVGNEKGKLRGKGAGGMRAISTWSATVLTTSETPLLEENTTTGARVRAFEIHGGLGAEDKNAVDTFYKNIFKAELSYGHLSAYIISIILNSKPVLQEKYDKAIVLLNDTLDGVAKSQSMQPQERNSIADRIINSFAVFLVSGWIFEKIMNELGESTHKPEDVIIDVMKDVIDETVTKPHHIQALQYIYDWINENNKSFTINKETPGGFTPKKIYGDYRDGQYIDIHIKTISKELKKGGFNYKRIKTEWETHKIIQPMDNDRPRIGGVRNRAISIDTNMVKSIMGEESPLTDKFGTAAVEKDVKSQKKAANSTKKVKVTSPTHPAAIGVNANEAEPEPGTVGFRAPPNVIINLINLIALPQTKTVFKFGKIVLHFDSKSKEIWWSNKVTGESFLVNFGHATYDYFSSCWGEGEIALSVAELLDYLRQSKKAKLLVFSANPQKRSYEIKEVGKKNGFTQYLEAISEINTHKPRIDYTKNHSENQIKLDDTYIPIL